MQSAGRKNLHTHHAILRTQFNEYANDVICTHTVEKIHLTNVFDLIGSHQAKVGLEPLNPRRDGDASHHWATAPLCVFWEIWGVFIQTSLILQASNYAISREEEPPHTSRHATNTILMNIYTHSGKNPLD